MKKAEDKQMEMIACESFIRRAAATGQPFMLKGSYITRQYFENPNDRIPNDLDWVYMQRIESVGESKDTFNTWATKVTKRDEEYIDGVKFRNFTENAFWRQIDYAMSDDFPTVSTDLAYWVDKQDMHEFYMDVSFNLDIKVQPVELMYHPKRGEPFLLPFTVPLPLQVSWKLHQTIVRPRFKDIFDLIHLLKHPSFTDDMAQQTVAALMDECAAGSVDRNRITWLFTNQLPKLFSERHDSYEKTWHYWRYDPWEHSPYANNIGVLNTSDCAGYITDHEKLPTDAATFEAEFYEQLQKAGLTIELIKSHPYR